MIYQGKSGKIYEAAEPPIGSGGEGRVYSICGCPDKVLKVLYPDKRTAVRHRKLLAMLASPLPAGALSQVSWPVDVIYENGSFTGYIMPLVKNRESLSAVCSGHHALNFREKAGIAKNLCSAVNAVHQAGQVCGDLNPNNITVDSMSGLVTLVDTDSYHITDRKDRNLYRCTVGMPEYMPAELQKKISGGFTLENAPLPTFTKETDLFALAVHIFSLLMNGCHPFACAADPASVNKTGGVSLVAPQPVENIRNGFFPFRSKGTGLTLPKYAPEFSVLPPDLRSLFIRAFEEGNTDPSRRPDAAEWFRALTDLQSGLKICRSDPEHFYPAHLTDCPWCALREKLQRPVLKQPVMLSQTPVISGNKAAAAAPPLSTPGTRSIPASGPKTPKKGRKLMAIAAAAVLLCILGLTGLYAGDHGVSFASPKTGTVSQADRIPYVLYLGRSSPELIEDSMSTDEEEHFYTVHAPYDGRYRFEIKEMNSGKVMLSLYDGDGTAVEEDICCSRGEGFTAKGLVGGEDYELKVAQFEGLEDYTLLIGKQERTDEIPENTELHDQIKYTDQRNMYTLIPKASGEIVVTVSGMEPETEIELCAFDKNKECICSSICGNGDSIRIKGLSTGESFNLQARQYTGMGDYVLDIGR